MRISFKNCDHLNGYTINGSDIPRQTSHKHLGLIIAKNLSFNDYVNNVYNKCLQKWSYIKRICLYANPEVLMKLYKTYIFAVIEYCSLCYNHNMTQTIKLERIQKRITRDICFKKFNKKLKYEERLKELNMTSLQTRRKLNVLKVVFKCVHDFEEMPYNWKNNYIISDNTRNGILIVKPNTRNTFCDKDFFIFSINLFNNLPKFIRNETKLNVFLTKCQKFYDLQNCFEYN